jgi:hypothetical protein
VPDRGGERGRRPATGTSGTVHAVRRLPDHPAVPAAVAGGAAIVLVVARLVFGTHGDVTQFIVVGAANVTGHGLPAGVHVFTGTGYDGQFYYRQALAPFDVSIVAHGIRLDGLYRLQRLGYPLLAYAAAAGRTSLVPITLVAVNVVGMAVAGLLGGIVARDAGRHAAYGLLLAGYFGLVTTLARDLTEIVECCFLLAALVAYRRHRHLLAGLAFACAVATKETEVFVVGAFGVVVIGRELLGRLGHGARPRVSAHLVWLLPAAAFVGIQLWLFEATHHLAGSSGAQGNFATPLTAPVHALAHYLSHPATLADAIWLAELGVLTVLVVAAVATLWRTTVPIEERVAFVFLIGLALSLSGEVWNGQADFRSLAPLFELAAVVLVGSRRRIGILAAIVAIAFLVTFVHRVRFT